MNDLAETDPWESTRVVRALGDQASSILAAMFVLVTCAEIIAQECHIASFGVAKHEEEHDHKQLHLDVGLSNSASRISSYRVLS